MIEVVDLVPVDPSKLKTAADAQSFGESFLKQMAENFNSDGYLQPFAVVVCTVVPQTKQKMPFYMAAIVGGDMRDEEDKEKYAAALRFLATEGKSIATFTGVEAWTVDYSLHGQTKEEVLRDYENLKPSAHPNRKEMLCAMLETTKYGRFLWTAEIKRDAEGKGSVGDFEMKETEGGVEAEGRFAQLNPPLDASDPDTQ